MCLCLAAFAALCAGDNVWDYGANFDFVRHVLSMDTTFHDPLIMGRAVTAPVLALLTRGERAPVTASEVLRWPASAQELYSVLAVLHERSKAPEKAESAEPEMLAPIAFSGDDGLTIVERASYGVIGSITPTTNPTETVINNGIGMIAGGNAVVFNAHPYAARTSAYLVHLLNEAIAGAGGPETLLTCVERPTIESAEALMRHPGVRLVVVTGGPGVVKAAMGSGKKVIAAGPGNPPAVVDETADLDLAAANIVLGASVDNNIICTAEKEIVAVASIADALEERLAQAGCHLVSGPQLKALEKIVLDRGSGGVHPNKDFIGKNAGVIARQIGVRAGDELRLLVAEVDEQHPFVQLEMLMPVLPLVRAPDAAEAIAMAKRVEHGFCHTAVMYSRNIAHLHAMARTINTSIFVKNASNLAGLGLGGEGYTSFTIASPTGEGLTTVRNFTRERRCTLKEYFRFV